MDQLYALDDVIATADGLLVQGVSAAAHVWPTGFTPLDDYLNGGLRSGELTLLGGPQGLGKTTLALQFLRHAVSAGGSGIYFSFEHDPPLILERILAGEAADRHGIDAAGVRRFREALEASDGRVGTLTQRVENAVGGPEAVHAVQQWGKRLHVHRSNGSSTTVDVIRDAVREVKASTGNAPLIVVDYLQKVPVDGVGDGEEARVTRVTEGLKDLALAEEIPVLAVVAADKEGITAGRRLRTHHLRGSSALAYEADVVLVANDKFDVVARHHLIYDVANAERYRDYVVLSLEKNRNGLDRIDLEFVKQLEHARFDPEGRVVNEQLVDERVFVE